MVLLCSKGGETPPKGEAGGGLPGASPSRAPGAQRSACRGLLCMVTFTAVATASLARGSSSPVPTAGGRAAETRAMANTQPRPREGGGSFRVGGHCLDTPLGEGRRDWGGHWQGRKGGDLC